MRPAALPAVAMALAGAVPACHLPNAASSAGSSFSIVVSPATIRVALPGLNQAACQLARSSRVMPSTLALVPLAGLP